MSVSEFYRIQYEKLRLEFQEVALFTSHPGTIGAFREQLLRERLKQCTPARFEVRSGFVATTEQKAADSIFTKQSRQIDCLVFDKTSRAPYLEANDWAIVDPQCICAAIEVKSKLTFYQESRKGSADSDYPIDGPGDSSFRWAGTLVDALQNIARTADVCHQVSRHYFAAVFAYEKNFDLMNLYRALDNQELQRQLGLTHLRQMPETICIVDSGLVWLTPTDAFDPAMKVQISGQTFFNLIQPSEETPSMPLQNFLTHYHHSMYYRSNDSLPQSSGLYSGATGKVALFSKPFDLDSEE